MMHNNEQTKHQLDSTVCELFVFTCFNFCLLIDEDKRKGQVLTMLQRLYTSASSSHTISKEDIERDIKYGFLEIGNIWQGNWEVVESSMLELFPKAKLKKRNKNKKSNRCV